MLEFRCQVAKTLRTEQPFDDLLHQRMAGAPVLYAVENTLVDFNQINVQSERNDHGIIQAASLSLFQRFHRLIGLPPNNPRRYPILADELPQRTRRQVQSS